MSSGVPVSSAAAERPITRPGITPTPPPFLDGAGYHVLVLAVQPLDIGVAQLYARALLAIARAGEELGLEEGLRLQEKIAGQTIGRVSL